MLFQPKSWELRILQRQRLSLCKLCCWLALGTCGPSSDTLHTHWKSLYRASPKRCVLASSVERGERYIIAPD